MSLNLLLDNANPIIWDEWRTLGIFKGITTNPTLLKEVEQPSTISNLKKLTHKAQRMGYKEIHLQAWGKSLKDLVKCGISLSKLNTSKIKR